MDICLPLGRLHSKKEELSSCNEEEKYLMENDLEELAEELGRQQIRITLLKTQIKHF